jgi:hypothetical protein
MQFVPRNSEVKKIPTLFERDWDGDLSRVTDVVNPVCRWVIDGEGVATRKWDGTAVLIKGGELFCRYDAKNGKTPPTDFFPAQEPDTETGHWPGWVPARKDQHKWQIAVFVTHFFEDGTYEACGPHFQSNPDNCDGDCFIPHGNHKYVGVPRTYEGLKEWFEKMEIEGLVFHHPDGRMAKIKRSDFGFPWGRK